MRPHPISLVTQPHTRGLHPGDGWSPRLEDAVLHGCIPVIIADRVHAVFESVLDIDSFAVRVAEADVPRVMDILRVRGRWHAVVP